MKKDNILDDAVTEYQKLDRYQQRTYMLSAIGGSVAFTILLIYFTISQKYHYVAQIRSAHSVAQKAVQLSRQNHRLNEDEQAFASFVQEKPLKGGLINYITTFAQKNQLTLLPDWQKSLETLAIPENEFFEEQRVTISINGQTTEKIVTIMEALRQERMILLRDIALTRNGESLNLKLILAARNRTTTTGL